MSATFGLEGDKRRVEGLQRVADLLGVASIIGASATFVGTTGAIWLQATGRSDRKHGDDANPDRDPISGLTDDELDEEMRRRDEQRERERKRREDRRRHIAAAIPVFLRRRRNRPVTSP